MELHQAEDSVQLIPESVHYSGEELPQHFIRSIAICSGMVGGKDGVIVEIILGRPLFAKFLTVSKEIGMISCICFFPLFMLIFFQVNLPTLMLIFLSQMVNRFTENYLDMVVQVNLTILLVSATL